MFPAIETYRQELQAMDYVRLGDTELAEVRARYAAAHHSNAIEGVHEDGEQLAFTGLLLDLRVPRDLTERYSDRFIQERIVGPALARQGAEAPRG